MRITGDDEACVFCDKVLMGFDPSAQVEYHHANTVASFLDRYGSAPGHKLIVPVAHVRRVGDLSESEWLNLWDVARRSAQDEADGFTIGINDGTAAGQTVPHVHLHVIPRRFGDVPDPRGGIRWVLPETADYWTRLQDGTA